MSVTTVVLAGVGGQGTILAGDVLAKVAVAEGHDVKLSEVHGMAQRGGSVDTVVRFGEAVHSPVVDPGVADHLIAFEMIEAARASFTASGRVFQVSRHVLPCPPHLRAGTATLSIASEQLQAAGTPLERRPCLHASPRASGARSCAGR